MAQPKRPVINTLTRPSRAEIRGTIGETTAIATKNAENTIPIRNDDDVSFDATIVKNGAIAAAAIFVHTLTRHPSRRTATFADVLVVIFYKCNGSIRPYFFGVVGRG